MFDRWFKSKKRKIAFVVVGLLTILFIPTALTIYNDLFKQENCVGPWSHRECRGIELDNKCYGYQYSVCGMPSISPQPPDNSISTSNNNCVAIWSNCNCAYKAVKKDKVDEYMVDCQRECTNKPTIPATALNIYGRCVIASETDRFDCRNYAKYDCPPAVTGCSTGGGTDSMPGTSFGCQGKIENTSVIVELNIPFEAEGYLSSEEVQKQRDLIKSTQKELISQIPGVYEIYKRYIVTPNLSIKVNQEALEFLQSSPLVKTVQEDKPAQPLN